MNDTIPESLSKKRNIIKQLAIKDMYTENSGLYCFMIMIATTAVSAIPITFIISMVLSFLITID